MFPIRDENPTIHTSVTTWILIALNVSAWIFLQGFGLGRSLAESIALYGFVPGEFLGTVAPGTQIALGDGLVYVVNSQRNWISPLTSMFMHGGWLHLIGNMWFLAVFADNVEDALGSVRFAIFYILCGLAAVAAQALGNPSSIIPMVGASGAIGGVMGAYFVLYPRAPVHMLVFLGFYITRIIVPAFFMLGYWFFLQVLEGFFSAGNEPGVAFWAHVGGFVSGIVLVRLFCSSSRTEECRLRRGRADGMIRRYRR